MIERIFTRSATDGSTHEHQSVVVVAGQGIEGDRYFGRHEEPGQNITLIEAEEVDRFNSIHGSTVEPSMTGRNIVTRGVRLNELVGRDFKLGSVKLRGVELCEPCMGLGQALASEKLAPAGVVESLLHRAGLRANVLSSGTVAVGGVVTSAA